MIDYALLELETFGSVISSNYKKWMEKLKDKGRLVIVEKNVYTGQNGNFMEIWYHLSEIPNHEKVAFVYKDIGRPFIMDIPFKLKRFNISNVENHAAYELTENKFIGFRTFCIDRQTAIGGQMNHSIKMPLIEILQYFPHNLYKHHTDYIEEDNIQ